MLEENSPESPRFSAEDIARKSRECAAAEFEDWLQAARTLLETHAFSEADLQMIMRGQLLTGAPCCTGKNWDVDALDYQPSRDSHQSRDKPPLAVVDVPRNRLRCPLQDRVENGDLTVPCCSAMADFDGDASLPPPQTTDEERRQKAIRALQNLEGEADTDFACSVYHWLAFFLVEALVHGGVPTAAPGQDGLGADQAREAERARQQLLYLMSGGRLGIEDLKVMIRRGVVVTDADWLPCQDDPERDFWMPEGLYDVDRKYHDHFDIRVPLNRWRCPLQVRARLGDGGVPCCEAQYERRDMAMVAAQHLCDPKRLPAEALSIRGHGRWALAGPEDPVRTGQMRPCHLLGQVLAHGLYALVEKLAALREPPGQPA